MAKIKIKLLASLKSAVGASELEVEAKSWREALLIAREKYPSLREVIRPDGSPSPLYILFVDGVDYRLVDDGDARELVILPVNHGGSAEAPMQSAVEFVELTWDDIMKAAVKVAEKIMNDGYKPDVIIGILRGGVVPARILADYLDVDDMTVMEIKFYTGVGVRQDRPYVRQPVILPLHNRRVLVVDDVSDTGLTLQTALEAIELYKPAEARTATLYIKPWTKFVPDYYADVINKWIVFPWDYWEFKRQSRIAGEK